MMTYSLEAIDVGGFATNLFGRLMVGMVPLIIIVVLFTIALRLSSRRRDTRSTAVDLIAADHASNSIRAKNVPAEMFYAPNINDLPIITYPPEEMETPQSPYFWQKKIVDTHQKKMLKFNEELTNIDLKNMYGQANLEFVARYEENFTMFTHTLTNWAKSLISNNNAKDAQAVLEFTVDAGSEISHSYTLLADLYAAKNNIHALQTLHTKAENSTMPHKTPTLSHIQNLIIQN